MVCPLAAASTAAWMVAKIVALPTICAASSRRCSSDSISLRADVREDDLQTDFVRERLDIHSPQSRNHARAHVKQCEAIAKKARIRSDQNPLVPAARPTKPRTGAIKHSRGLADMIGTESEHNASASMPHCQIEYP